jgi:hypothetical protein
MALHYEVPGVHLIRQDKENACWFASAMMLINWKERNRPGAGMACSGVDSETLDLYKANDGIHNDQIISLAKRLGLVAVAPQTPSMDGLLGWLKLYGPLWTNGVRHIVVIGGVKEVAVGRYSVKVYNPWPGIPVLWRDFSGWYEGSNPKLRDNGTRDVGFDVKAVFLHI